MSATPPASRDEALRLIGQCWAGGELTGKALEHFHLGDYAAAKETALAQLRLQDERQ
jgi:hypothetical protein